MLGIVETRLIRPSLESRNPADVRYGEGRYLADIPPGTMTPARLSRALIGHPFQGRRFTHYVEIDPRGLSLIAGRRHVYVVPGTQPLDVTGRITAFGENQGALHQGRLGP